MVDGKVYQALTETPSSQACYICGAKPSMMNKLEEVKLLPVKMEKYSFGLTTLNAWIRFIECILHIAYRSDFFKWAALLPDQKQKMSEAKKRIQKEFCEEVGLIVDFPQHRSGTSNNGNTARRFFLDPELTSSITGVDKVLFEKFGIILQAMTSGKRIDFIKFEEYCEETAKLYVSLYEWFKMPVIREFNTRKISRMATNEDLGHKLLIMTDPYINYFRSLHENLTLPTCMKAEA